MTKAKLNKNDEIVDLYCGIGTIGLIASKYVTSVIGVEVVNEAIIDAKENYFLFQSKFEKYYVYEKKMQN